MKKLSTRYVEKPTQEQRILELLKKRKGKYVSGRHFLHIMNLSQYHARIWGLQQKGHSIEASVKRDKYGFKSYRLIQK